MQRETVIFAGVVEIHKKCDLHFGYKEGSGI